MRFRFHSIRRCIVATLLPPLLVPWGVAVGAETAPGSTPYRVPFMLARGKSQFDRYCTECHGAWADGTDKGPPLVHIFYEPSHHNDAAFRRAITSGTKQHHWNFGDMQPVPEVDQKEIDKITGYVRWLQQQNGIQ